MTRDCYPADAVVVDSGFESAAGPLSAVGQDADFDGGDGLEVVLVAAVADGDDDDDGGLVVVVVGVGGGDGGVIAADECAGDDLATVASGPADSGSFEREPEIGSEAGQRSPIGADVGRDAEIGDGVAAGLGADEGHWRRWRRREKQGLHRHGTGAGQGGVGVGDDGGAPGSGYCKREPFVGGHD